MNWQHWVGRTKGQTWVLDFLENGLRNLEESMNEIW